jgi:uncharacterized cupin superfamily protein
VRTILPGDESPWVTSTATAWTRAARSSRYEGAMSEQPRHPHVVNIASVEPRAQERGGFANKVHRLGAAAGGRALGCSHVEVPPGKTAWPFHFHSAIEEALYILEGEGTLRIGAERVPVRAGDYIALPAGPDTVHQLLNTGSAPLRYLAMSGPAEPTSIDVVKYPDSKKVAFAAGVKPGKGFADAWAYGVVKEGPPVDYYEDEPLAKG